MMDNDLKNNNAFLEENSSFEELNKKYQRISQEWIAAQTEIEQLKELLMKANQEGRFEWEKQLQVETDKIRKEMERIYSADSNKIKRQYLQYMEFHKKLHNRIQDMFYAWSGLETMGGCHMSSMNYQEYCGKWRCEDFLKDINEKIAFYEKIKKEIEERTWAPL
jgi:hypothetical protein